MYILNLLHFYKSMFLLIHIDVVNPSSSFSLNAIKFVSMVRRFNDIQRKDLEVSSIFTQLNSYFKRLAILNSFPDATYILIHWGCNYTEIKNLYFGPTTLQHTWNKSKQSIHIFLGGSDAHFSTLEWVGIRPLFLFTRKWELSCLDLLLKLTHLKLHSLNAIEIVSIEIHTFLFITFKHDLFSYQNWFNS